MGKELCKDEPTTLKRNIWDVLMTSQDALFIKKRYFHLFLVPLIMVVTISTDV